MNHLEQAGNLIDKVGTQIDENSESGEERQEQLTKRLEIDMASDNKLSKNIRPIALIYSMAAITIVLGLEFFLVYTGRGHFDPIISGYVFGLTGAAWGFYFNSRKHEKINNKRSETALKIEEQKNKAELTAEKETNKLKSKWIRRQIRQGKLTAEEAAELFDDDQ